MVTPNQIGRYRIECELGRGGMGVVYAGYDDQLDRPVAVKTIGVAEADPLQRKRFAREAKAAARVRHPNVCQIYEIAEADDEPFIVMELLEGESLATRLGRGALPLIEAIAVADEILAALVALHEQRMMHRDLKPSNIFLTRHGVKLLDFGLAREIPGTAVESEDETASQLTAAGSVVGTPAYMAPEQLRAQPVDGRTDLFALGAVVFEMLTAKRPFAGATALEIYDQTMREQPMALTGSTSIRQLDGVIRRALAKRPDDRFQSAAAMRDALGLVDTSVDADDPPRAHAITRLIVLPFRLLRPDPETDFLGFAVPDAVAGALGRLDSLVVRSSATAARFSAGELDPGKIAVEADIDVVVTGSLMRVGERLRVPVQMVEVPGGTVLWSQQLEVTMRDLFQLQDEIVRHIVESLSLSLTARETRKLRGVVPASPTAYEFFLRGNQRMEPGLVDREGLLVARDLYEQCLAEDAGYAPAFVRLGRCHYLLGKGGEDSLGNFARAESSLARALELSSDNAEAHHAYALIEIDKGHAQDAMVRLVRLASESDSEPQLYKALEQACRSSGLFEASIASHEKARQLDAHILTSAYVSQWYLGSDDKALEWLPPHPAYADVIIFAMRGEEEKAIRLLKQREQLRLPPVVRDLLVSLRTLLEGEREASLEHAERCFDAGAHAEFALLASRHVAYFDEHERCIEMLGEILDHGFNPFRHLVRTDPWLGGLEAQAGYDALFDRARRAYDSAVAAFEVAGGERLLALELPSSDELVE